MTSGRQHGSPKSFGRRRGGSIHVSCGRGTRFPVQVEMMRRVAALTLALFLFCSCLGPPQPRMGPSVAEATLSSTKARAKQEGKHVFLLFVAPECDWCDCFDRYHDDPEVRRLVDKYFVLARVAVKATPGGEPTYLAHGGTRGAPAFTPRDHHCAFLASSGYAGNNIGFPANEEEVNRYIECLKTACPKLTDEDVAVLRRKLAETRRASSGGHAEEDGEAKG